jgi:hypothetical protein|tara:strand:- start:122 stop:979 length:858 start_codon:yes stop_codon:yes gene_type:complete
VIEVNTVMKYAITGHSRGIGKCCYDLFTADGHEVLGFSRSNGYDIRDPESRKQIVEQSLDADVFINNAAGYFHADTIPEDYRKENNSVWDEEGYFPQTRMFMEIWEHFHNEEKTVVNINSAIQYSRNAPSANKVIIVEPREQPYLVTDETVWSNTPSIKAQQTYFRSKEQLFAVVSYLVGIGVSGGAKKWNDTGFLVDYNLPAQQILKGRCINLSPGWIHTDMFPMFADGRKMLPEDIAEIIKWTINMPKNVEIFELGVRKKISNKEAGLSTKGKDFTSIPPIKA